MKSIKKQIPAINSVQKKHYKINKFCFDNSKLTKKNFTNLKQPINLDLVNIDQIVISGKFKHNDDGFKQFIGYKEDDTVKPLCIILPQMRGYMKYFENGGKNVLEKYN